MKTYATSNILLFKCGRQGFCCKNWCISLSREVFEAIEKDPSNVFSDLEDVPEYAERSDGKSEERYAKTKLVEGKCVFLDSSNSCRIFKAFGKDKGNPLCLSYPFFKLLLKGRVQISTALSCTSETEALFEPHSLSQVELPPDHEQRIWPVTDFSNHEAVIFSDGKSLDWEAYFHLEKTLLESIGKENVSLGEILGLLASLHSSLLKNPKPLLEVKDLIPLFQNRAEEISPTNKAETLFTFIQRKINLYHFQPFIDSTQAILSLDPQHVFGKDRPDFEKAFNRFEPALKKYLLIKLFSNPLNFTKSVQFFWHTLFFHLSFIKIYSYSQWKQEKGLTRETVLEGIRTTERNFLHDSRVFEFWGQGRRGTKDFGESSLASLIL